MRRAPVGPPFLNSAGASTSHANERLRPSRAGVLWWGPQGSSYDLSERGIYRQDGAGNNRPAFTYWNCCLNLWLIYIFTVVSGRSSTLDFLLYFSHNGKYCHFYTHFSRNNNIFTLYRIWVTTIKKKKLYSSQSNQKQHYLTRQPDPLTQFVIMQI